MRRLKRYDIAVKGGFRYIQPETGFKFDGNNAWRAQIRQIRAHRVGNQLPRQSLEQIADDLEAYTCNRLPNMCSDREKQLSNTAVQRLTQQRVGGCASCGGRKRVAA